MKFHMEVECTPEEARRAVGLPDLTPVHERYVGMMLEGMSGGLRPEMIEQLGKGWAPMGEAGLALWRSLVERGLSAAGTASKPNG